MEDFHAVSSGGVGDPRVSRMELEAGTGVWAPVLQASCATTASLSLSFPNFQTKPIIGSRCGISETSGDRQVWVPGLPLQVPALRLQLPLHLLSGLQLPSL